MTTITTDDVPEHYRGVKIPKELRQRWQTVGRIWCAGVDALASTLDINVEPGQEWVDNDYRTKGRRIRVDEILDDGRVLCTVIAAPTRQRGKNVNTRGRVGHQVRIKRRRFYPGARGYRRWDG